MRENFKYVWFGFRIFICGDSHWNVLIVNNGGNNEETEIQCGSGGSHRCGGK
jgi:hypothetical protein